MFIGDSLVAHTIPDILWFNVTTTLYNSTGYGDMNAETLGNLATLTVFVIDRFRSSCVVVSLMSLVRQNRLAVICEYVSIRKFGLNAGIGAVNGQSYFQML